MLGCIAGSALVRKAASLAFKNKRRSTLTCDIIECLGKRYPHFFLLSKMGMGLLVYTDTQLIVSLSVWRKFAQ